MDSQDISENTFAAACYDQNTLEDLETMLTGEADQQDMAEWDISANEWREHIEIAIAALTANRRNLIQWNA